MKKYVFLTALFVPTAFAVDGVVLIDQNRALAGGVTPGDTPGFPVTLSVSGSYKLSSNLVLPLVTSNGVVVTADNVTLDLNGFTIKGPNVCVLTVGPFNLTCANTGDSGICYVDFSTGFGVLSGGNNLKLSNGNITGMGTYGVCSYGAAARISRVNVSHSGVDGIDIGVGVVEDSEISLSYGNGVICSGAGARVMNSYFIYNGAFGINAAGTTGYQSNTLLTNRIRNNAVGPQVAGGINLGGNNCGSGGCP